VLEFRLSDRVRLRLLEERDAPAFYGVIERNRDYLAQWMPWAPGQTEEGTLQFIRSTRSQLAESNGLNTAIEVDGDLGGMVGMVRLDKRNHSTELGYWLAEEHQGQGIMTAGVRAYLDYAFGSLGLRRVAIGAGTENRRSRAIPERLGFTYEGTLRQAEALGERSHDVAFYSMLADEWLSAASAASG
jgi:ribosomal-protein-serine acetyltransferase